MCLMNIIIIVTMTKVGSNGCTSYKVCMAIAGVMSQASRCNLQGRLMQHLTIIKPMLETIYQLQHVCTLQDESV